MTERIEEFTRHGRRYIYYDLSEFKTNDEFREFIAAAKPVIEKYKKYTVHTIANVEGVRFDSETKALIAGWMEHNAPYVKHGAAIGMDGMKKIMLDSIMAQIRRDNLAIANSKKQAIAMLKQREWAKWDKI